MAAKKPNQKPDYGTTGHEWDGIHELNTPMPRWWLWTFYLTIIWGIGYVIAYPAWPLINGATEGLLGYSTRGEVQAEIDRFDAANAEIEAKLAATEMTEIAADEELEEFAHNAGEAVYNTWCVQCHGRGGGGFEGYPTLADNDWLWGGTIDDIYTTVNHGIRNEEDLDARFSQMPAFGDFMAEEEITALVSHVQAISNKNDDLEPTEAGTQLYLDNCAACHADEGTGDRFQGAPDLTDAIWLYGGDVEALTETITNARFGVMPAWQSRLSESDVRAVAAYVHQLGGGE